MKLAIAVLAALLASCTFVEATTTWYDGLPKYERTDPGKVQVLMKEPTVRFERIGEVKLNISVDPPAPIADIEDKLREEASRWGADAVYVIRDTISKREGHQLVAIAIRYVK